MNAIRQTQQLNKRELENAIPPSASWHADYRDTAWVYIGGLPLDLSEGDVLIIFSQFGNPTHLNLIRDRDTGKSKGFGFLKYEDQRSCDLAVDNLTGAEVLGRMLRVDHSRYKKKDGEDEETHRVDRLEAEAEAEENTRNGKRTSDTEESDDEARRKKLRRYVEDKKRRLTIRDRPEEEGESMAEYVPREKSLRRSRQYHKHRDHKDRDRASRRHRCDRSISESDHENSRHHRSSHPQRSRSDNEEAASKPSRRRERSSSQDPAELDSSRRTSAKRSASPGRESRRSDRRRRDDLDTARYDDGTSRTRSP